LIAGDELDGLKLALSILEVKKTTIQDQTEKLAP
jgi:hypothetical protein